MHLTQNLIKLKRLGLGQLLALVVLLLGLVEGPGWLVLFFTFF